LTKDEVEFTVTGVSDAGDSIGEVTAGDLLGVIQIKPEYQGTHYLLKLEISMENLSDESVALGAGNLRARDEEGDTLQFGGFCPTDTMCGSRLVIETKAGDTVTDVGFVFVAPNELQELTVDFLGCPAWADIKTP
jgi:hypothetical protein